MSNSSTAKGLILYFRFVMAWTFLYAASAPRVRARLTLVGFLNHTKTWHDVFVVFTTSTMAPITTFLVEYGHLLIGLSLLTGLMVRVSAGFGVSAHDHLLVRAHGLAVHREYQQPDRRLSPESMPACWSP